MTDHDPSDDHLRDSDDVVDEEVRSLLADVRADAPMPASVASRLDDVLASLVAERADGGVDDAAPVAPTPVDLAAERGRRRRRTWLGVAAAAVVLVAAGAVVPQLVSSDDRSTSADSVRDPDAAGAVDGVPSLTRAGLAEEVQSYLLAEAVTESAAAAADPSETPEPTAGELPGVGAPLDESLDASAQADRRPTRGGATVSSGDCLWTGAGQVRDVVYDGEPALLVLTENARGRVVARVVSCVAVGSTVVRTVTLPSDVPLP